MVEKIKALLIKYEEIIVYLVVGVLNTIVSWGACFVGELLGLDPTIEVQNGILNTIGWVVGVVFGYFANRIYVFKSTNPQILKEFIQFAGGRVSTWRMDILIMFIMVNVLNVDYWISKICVAAVLVMIANYVISKLLVFRKKKED